MPEDGVEFHVAPDAVDKPDESSGPLPGIQVESGMGFTADYFREGNGDEGACPGVEVDDATWRSNQSLASLIGQHRPVKKLEIRDGVDEPGQFFGFCGVGTGVVMPRVKSGVVPQMAVSFKVAREVYRAGSGALDLPVSTDPFGRDDSDDEVVDIVPRDASAVVTPRMKSGSAKLPASSSLKSYFSSASRHSGSSSSAERGAAVKTDSGLPAYDTPYGRALHTTGQLKLVNGSVMIRNATEPSKGVADRPPSFEGTSTDSLAYNVARKPGKRLGSKPQPLLQPQQQQGLASVSVSFGRCVVDSGRGGVSSGEYVAKAMTGGGLRKPFKKPRVNAPASSAV